MQPFKPAPLTLQISDLEGNILENRPIKGKIFVRMNVSQSSLGKEYRGGVFFISKENIKLEAESQSAFLCFRGQKYLLQEKKDYSQSFLPHFEYQGSSNFASSLIGGSYGK